MHECPECGQACDCDIDDLWWDEAPADCDCDHEGSGLEEDEDFEELGWEEHP